MSVIVILIGFSLLVAGGFLAAFIWAVKSGQYNDTYTPSVRVLFENKAADKGGSEKKLNGDNKEKEEQE